MFVEVMGLSTTCMHARLKEKVYKHNNKRTFCRLVRGSWSNLDFGPFDAILSAK